MWVAVNDPHDYIDVDVEIVDGGFWETSAVWFKRAAVRKERVNKYLWNEEKELYCDYNVVEGMGLCICCRV